MPKPVKNKKLTPAQKKIKELKKAITEGEKSALVKNFNPEAYLKKLHKLI